MRPRKETTEFRPPLPLQMDDLPTLSDMGLWGLGFQDFGGLGFGVLGLRILGLRVWGLGFKVSTPLKSDEGFGFKA